MLITSLIFAFGCSQYFVVDDDDSAASEIQWQGWVYADIPQDDTLGLEVGSITVENQDGDELVNGVQADETRPSMWTLDVPTNTEVAIRVEGPNQYTTVWRTTTPRAAAYWYAGSLFAVQPATIQPLWDSLTELLEQPITDTDGAHLYGEPLLLWADDDIAWTDAVITVYDGDGTVHPAITFSSTETGELILSTPETGPITAFTATDLAAGPIRLVIDASDGRSVVMDYNAQPGDLLSAFAFTLPEPTQ
jgi:hypothetical protein